MSNADLIGSMAVLKPFMVTDVLLNLNCTDRNILNIACKAQSDNARQDDELNALRAKDVQQDNRLTVLENKPDFTQQQADWNQTNTSAASYIKNKPNVALKSDLTAINNKNASQDTEINNVKNVNTTQNGRLDDLEECCDTVQGQITTINNKNTQQDNRISALEKRTSDNESAIKQLQAQSVTVNGKIEVPRHISVAGNSKLITPVDLGTLTPDTRIEISWNQGSTRRTDSYTAAELRTNNCHITGENLTDSADDSTVFESYTKIKDTNKLWITTTHAYRIHTDNISWLARSFDSSGNVYYDSQNPDYAAQTNGQSEGINVTSITVYDLIDPVVIE